MNAFVQMITGKLQTRKAQISLSWTIIFLKRDREAYSDGAQNFLERDKYNHFIVIVVNKDNLEFNKPELV